MGALLFYRPALTELSFRQSLLQDSATMAYNAHWGGTIAFPRERWLPWYQTWVEAPASQRFYRYLRDGQRGVFVGEAAYRLDEERGVYIAHVLVHARERRRGYGGEALEMLCQAAQSHGVGVLYDDIAADNPAISLFLRHGFTVEAEESSVQWLKKRLTRSLLHERNSASYACSQRGRA